MNQVKVFSHEIMPFIKERLSQDQEVYLTVSGTSMKPFYHHQKTVVKLIKPTFPIDKYSVCLFFDQGLYKLHRLIKIKDDQYIMNGDGLKAFETIQKDQIFGIVSSHEYKSKVVLKNSKFYLFKVRIWSLLRPFRSILLRLLRGNHG